MKHKAHELTVKTGDVVLIKGDKKNRGKWKMELVKQIIPGRDRNVRAVKLKTGKGELERTIQHLYPLELACDMEEPTKKIELDAKAPEFRPKRKTSEEATNRLKGISIYEDDELYNRDFKYLTPLDSNRGSVWETNNLFTVYWFKLQFCE